MTQSFVERVVPESCLQVFGRFDARMDGQRDADLVRCAVDTDVEKIRISMRCSRDDLITEKSAIKPDCGAIHRSFPKPPPATSHTLRLVGF